ncbi:uncharacterized protein LOC108917570 isoform X2 [Anoplophora glabripennis]|nr:uncharacterized protein LOC108917570 isoform X2 [Anoplophora glabripennis]XP_018579766.1 uncharacterized protein LOC108917570 isoform X2 [Anoplophora glabripennis]
MGIMWTYLTFFICFTSAVEQYSSSYYCANMQPQQIMSVPQLMGMWFVVEKIDHLDERHYAKRLRTCPVIHISEDRSHTTLNPLYKGNQYRGYGEGFGYGTDGSQYGKTREQIDQERRQKLEYVSGMTHERNYPRRTYQNYNMDKGHLRIYWDEEGDSTEYHVWYNITEPGFWISSGPENGAVLKSQFSHYAGNIQVQKVVGDHMVLTFCHPQPRQFFSVLLSRETKLSSVEVHSVHRMLDRKGFKISAVEKLCNKSGRFALSNWLGLSLVVLFYLQNS